MGRKQKRYCAMGPKCYHAVRGGLGGPVPLGPSHKGDICDKCRDTDYRPEATLAVSAEVRGLFGLEKCTACLRPTRGLSNNDSGERLCESCRAVIKAACVLFEHGITDEARVIPTFVCAACAAEMPKLVTYASEFQKVAEGSEAERMLQQDFRNDFGSFEAEKNMDGVLVVKWASFYVRIHYSREGSGWIEKVTIDVYSERVKSKDIADRYEKVLRGEGMSYDSLGRGWIGFEYPPDCLSVVVKPDNLRRHLWGGMLEREESSSDQLLFPTPEQVTTNFKMLKRLSGGRLMGGERGPRPEAQTLIPACLAFYIRGLERWRYPDTKIKAELNNSVVRVIDNHLAPFLDKGSLFTRATLNAKALWNRVDEYSLRILRADDELRKQYSQLILRQ